MFGLTPFIAMIRCVCIALPLLLAVTAASAQSQAETNRALIRSAYESFARGDIPTVMARMHEKIEWTSAEGHPYAGTYVGPAAVGELFARIGAEWERYDVVPDEYLADADRVIVLGEYRGTYRATGRSFQAAFAHVWRLEDAKVVHFRQFTDTAPVVRAVTN